MSNVNFDDLMKMLSQMDKKELESIQIARLFY